MLYVNTGVLVALHTHEAKSADVSLWYTGAQAAWRQFDEVMAKNAKRLKFKLVAF